MPQKKATEPNEIEPVQAETLPVVQGDMTPEALISQAIQSGASVAIMKQMMDMRRELNEEASKKAFFRDWAELQKALEPIKKTDSAHHGKYAKFDKMQKYFDPVIHAHGFAYDFDQAHQETGSTYTCIVRHKEGFEKRNSIYLKNTKVLQGGGNDAQNSGSLISYGNRYAFKAAFAITETDEDTDGVDAPHSSAVITDDEVANIQAVIDEIKGFNKDGFLKTYEVESYAEIPAPRYKEIMRALIRRRDL